MTETLSLPTTYGQVLKRHPDMHAGLREHTERLALSNGETIPREEVEELGEIADEGASVIIEPQPGYGEQLSIKDELTGLGQWPITDAQKGIMPNGSPSEATYDLSAMSPSEEDIYIRRKTKHIKAQAERESDAIDQAEYAKILNAIHKTPREYQQPLLKLDGQLLNKEQPIDNDPGLGVSVENGTFWHTSNQLMEPGDRLLPSAEVPDLIHGSNTELRSFTSTSAPKGSSYDKEQHFAMGTPREAGYLPSPDYGKYVYKVSSPNTKIVPTINGPEAWAEGGGRIEERMHPDFADNYSAARSRIIYSQDSRQPALEGMENGMVFVSEAELNVPRQEFYDKYQKEIDDAKYKIAPNPGRATSEDVALPGLEHYGKKPYAPNTSPNQVAQM